MKNFINIKKTITLFLVLPINPNEVLSFVERLDTLI
jgi:hypothetical protein